MRGYLRAQGCVLSLGLAVLCGTDLHEIVERLVEGEGGGGGRGCASGRFALAVAGQACSCRHARHGRLVFVGALVAFLAKKRVKKARGSTNGQNSPFLGLRKSNFPKTVLASGAGNQKETQTGWLSVFLLSGDRSGERAVSRRERGVDSPRRSFMQVLLCRSVDPATRPRSLQAN